MLLHSQPTPINVLSNSNNFLIKIIKNKHDLLRQNLEKDNCKNLFFSGYIYQEFVNFQNLIDMAYIEMVTGEKLLPQNRLDFGTMNYVSQ